MIGLAMSCHNKGELSEIFCRHRQCLGSECIVPLSTPTVPVQCRRFTSYSQSYMLDRGRGFPFLRRAFERMSGMLVYNVPGLYMNSDEGRLVSPRQVRVYTVGNGYSPTLVDVSVCILLTRKVLAIVC
jgi:hypothetical protein